MIEQSLIWWCKVAFVDASISVALKTQTTLKKFVKQ